MGKSWFCDRFMYATTLRHLQQQQHACAYVPEQHAILICLNENVDCRPISDVSWGSDFSSRSWQRCDPSLFSWQGSSPMSVEDSVPQYLHSWRRYLRREGPYPMAWKRSKLWLYHQSGQSRPKGCGNMGLRNRVQYKRKFPSADKRVCHWHWK